MNLHKCTTKEKNPQCQEKGNGQSCKQMLFRYMVKEHYKKGTTAV